MCLRYFSKTTHELLMLNLKYTCTTASYCTFPHSFPQGKFVDKYYDVIVVGGGIIGVTTARELLLSKPELKIALIEKENDLGCHQTGHNSGVIHAGIYYKPGSLKALFCASGLRATYQFCDEHNIPYKKCGKLVVAVKQEQLSLLEYLYRQGIANDVPDIKLVDADEIKKIEPNCQGLAAIHSPHTGIVDYKLITKRCAENFETLGGTVYCNFELMYFRDRDYGSYDSASLYPIEIFGKKDGEVLRSRFMVVCAGLYSDHLAKFSFGDNDPVIVPFRGEYLELSKEKSHLINGNIYPVPDPQFPFLGVHFTPKLDGTVHIGPNAVLAFSKEGYSWKDINFTELYQILKHPGFRKLSKKYIRFGFNEVLNSMFKRRQLSYLHQYIPDISIQDLSRGPSGVRAQALNSDGQLVEDFELHIGLNGIDSRILHCRNTPSPAATSCFPISKFICSKAILEFKL